MRFYGIQPSEWKALDDVERLGLLQNIPRIKAAEKLEWMQLVGGTFTGEEMERRAFQVELTEVAFADDDANRAAVLEVVTRKR